MDLQKAIMLSQQEGNSYWVLGDLYNFKITGKETNGSLTLVEEIVQPQSGPPPHMHHQEDETFYVLEGRFSFLCGNEQREVGSGAVIYAPRNILHTFKNIGEQPGRLLVFITPAGLEEFFYEIGSPATDTNTPPPFDPSVFDKIMQLTAKYQLEVQLPVAH